MPCRRSIVAKSTFSSCSPIGALMAGVKIGSGSLSPSRNPSGSGTPHTVPLCWYSTQPEPVRYPRATHSTSTMSSDSTMVARPATASGTCVEMTWLGTSSWSNHHSESWVRMAPLSGMLVASTWSKAEMLSVATIRIAGSPSEVTS